jgi:hypothetical protein
LERRVRLRAEQWDQQDAQSVFAIMKFFSIRKENAMKVAKNQTAFRKPDTQPLIPDELWGLWFSEGNGAWVHPIDDYGTEEEAMMVFRSQQDAEDGARYHAKHYEAPCVAVRIK